MGRTWNMLIGVMVVYLAFFLGPLSNFTGAEEIDYEEGVVLSEEGVEVIEPQQVQCTLNVPSNLQNGDKFTFSVSYSPNTPAGDRTEKFIFKWPTRCDDFKEKTVRIKKFTPGGVVSGSFEDAVVPGALCVEGTFNAKVKVRGSVNCKATAPMTITNP